MGDKVNRMNQGLVFGLLISCFIGCSSAQLKQTNDIYEGLHSLRKNFESIPGVIAVSNSLWPQIKDVRLALDTAYAVKSTLVPDTRSLGVDLSLSSLDK